MRPIRALVMPAPAAVLCAALLAPLSAGASDPPGGQPLSAAAFEAHVTGRTLTYSQFGQVYGVEEYLPGRKVRWAFTEDECRYGSWYEDAGRICFVYEYDPAPQCWTFWLEEGRLKALFDGDTAGQELSEVAQSAESLLCPGPDVGV